MGSTHHTCKWFRNWIWTKVLTTVLVGDSIVCWTWNIPNFYGRWLPARVLQYFSIQISTIRTRWWWLKTFCHKFRNCIRRGSFCKKNKRRVVIDHRRRIEKKFRPSHNLKRQSRRLLACWGQNETKLGPWWMLFWNHRTFFAGRAPIEKEYFFNQCVQGSCMFWRVFNKTFIKINEA